MELAWELILLITIIVVNIIVYIFVGRERPKSLVGRHVVITGGSKGIGLCLAVECALKGANVTVIARDEKMLTGAVALMEVLRQTREQKFQYRCLDIGGEYAEIVRVLEDIEETFGDIYMLINCAGMAICGLFEDVPVEDAHKLMSVNYYGSYHCTRYVLPKMKKAREGIIVVVSSQASLFGIYGYGPYSASKYALRAMAETIAMETRNSGITVTLALPCDTNTPGYEQEEKSKPRETKILSSSGGLLEPEVMAKRILNDALTGKFSSFYGFESWVITVLGGTLFPWSGFFTNFLHVLVITPLRVLAYFLHIYFNYVLRRCAEEKCAVNEQFKHEASDTAQSKIKKEH